MDQIKSDLSLADLLSSRIKQAVGMLGELPNQNQVLGDNTKVQGDCQMIYGNGKKAVSAYSTKAKQDGEHLKEIGVELNDADKKIEQSVAAGGANGK